MPSFVATLVKVVSSVSTLDLEPIEKLENDLLVCKDGWVGAIRSVTVLVKLRLFSIHRTNYLKREDRVKIKL